MNNNFKLFIQTFLIIYSLIIIYLLNDILINYWPQYNRINDIIYIDYKYNESLNYLKHLKKVVYSAIFGNYDDIKKVNPQNGFDYILFSDNYNSNYKNNKTNWIFMPIPEIVNNLNISIVKKQRFLKLHPHLFFQKYDLSIYIDSNFEIKEDLNEFLLRILTPKYNIYFFEHPDRNNNMDETFAVTKYNKEKNTMAKLVRERYKFENFTDNGGLIEGCLIIRKHNEKKCINLMNKWYEEIEKYSYRDQLSFNYVLWKEKDKIKYISKNYALEYFNQNYHLKVLKLNDIDKKLY